MKNNKAKSVRFPQAHQIRRMLGLNPGKLPTNLVQKDFTLDGLHFHLLPAGFNKNRPHRLVVDCNVCGKTVSVGRFNQHQGLHPMQSLSELSLNYLKEI